MTLVLWRVFPWDPAAERGAPFSPEAPPGRLGSGRFDLPGVTPVRYFAESPEHAVAEVIQGLRNQTLDVADLVRVHPLALVEARLDATTAARIADLCDPAVLLRLGARPDRVASRDAAATQAVAHAVFGSGAVGLRWWSALSGDWHTVVLFDGALPVGGLTYGTPERLAVTSKAVVRAAASLQIVIRTTPSPATGA